MQINENPQKSIEIYSTPTQLLLNSYLTPTQLLLLNSLLYGTTTTLLHVVTNSESILNTVILPQVVSLLGDINKQSELYKILYTYVRNISFFNSKNPIFNNQTEINRHSNFILLGHRLGHDACHSPDMSLSRPEGSPPGLYSL